MLRKALLAVSLVGVTAAAGVGVTYALFSDTKESAPAEFTVGTLELHGYRNQGDTVYGPMFYIDGEDDGQTDLGEDGLYPTGLWAPGDSHRRVFEIENVGSLEARLTEIGAEIEQGSLDLASALQVVVRHEHDNGPIVAQGSLADFIAAPQTLAGAPITLGTGTWPATPKTNFRIFVELPLSTGNPLQGETLKVTFFVNAEQVKNNP